MEDTDSVKLESLDIVAMNVELMNAEPMNTEMTQPTTRRRRKKSLVWEHFTVEVVAGGCTRACCKLCKQTFAYSNGSKVAGTSHLKRHISLGACPKIKNIGRKELALTSGETIDGKATDPPKKRYRTPSILNVFDQEQSNTYLAKMIIVHEYPLHMVENPAFISFVQSLQPRFKMVDVNAMEDEILSVFNKEKQNLKQILETLPGKISLAIGLWTTSQTLQYICLSGQFIDSDWKLHRRMLNFMMVSSLHSENALTEAISVSLSNWNIKEKLFTITLDNNYSMHGIHGANLTDHPSNKNTLLLKSQSFVVRCYADILNVIAHHALASIHGIVYNIRESIKFVKVSPAWEEKFAEITSPIGIPRTKALFLDVPFLWNTTYLMLDAALEYKVAFSFLENCEANYNEAPSADDWKKVEVVCSFLKLMYDSANTVMETADQTANVFFQEACQVLIELTSSSLSQDTMVSSIAKEMHEKFDNYWKDCSLVLAVGVVMDPRFKMKLVEFNFSKIYGEDSTRYVRAVNDNINELYLDYASQPFSSISICVDERDTNHMNANDGVPPTTSTPSGGLLDFDIYLSEMEVNHSTKSELDQYLEEPVVPRNPGFDILNWWKLNSLKYPTLCKMARDILAIPVSIVGTGCSIFGSGTGTRVLDDYQSSLQPETVEALFCARDWLQYTPTTTEPPSTSIVKMEL